MSSTHWSNWYQSITAQVSDVLAGAIPVRADSTNNPHWNSALEEVSLYVNRPGKRFRPALVAAGYGLATGKEQPNHMLQFAAGTELLHAFMLVHDDVADKAATRRGEPALHELLGPGKLGEDLAVVLGDYLFARALELMMTDPACAGAVRYYLGVCRKTAAGQFSDIQAQTANLHTVTEQDVLEIAELKTAHYSFAAPLTAGAMLAGAAPEYIRDLESWGMSVGLAYQLTDDLQSIYGEPDETGKPNDADFKQSKLTYPVVRAFARATPTQKLELEYAWTRVQKTPATFQHARELLQKLGGRRDTEQRIAELVARAAAAAAKLDNSRGLVDFLSDTAARVTRLPSTERADAPNSAAPECAAGEAGIAIREAELSSAA